MLRSTFQVLMVRPARLALRGGQGSQVQTQMGLCET
jgi:hypothetical protein